ncbi:helix-turn-helix domain-containing protein [Paracoccus sp. PARArs4]|uniref:helix-turn-helix domain-containing protein n=1 Tax=Paracoccus sp. PARArs4 TaxID=2853442 RepID=UPI0032B86114
MPTPCDKRRAAPTCYTNIYALSWADGFRTIPQGPKALLLFLARKADAYGCSYYKKEAMAASLGCSRRTVQNHLRILENYGLLRTIGRCANFHQISNVYHLIGWLGRAQLPLGGHRELGQYVKEPSQPEFMAALEKQNLLRAAEKFALHNNSNKLLTTSAEEDVLEICIAALGTWITPTDRDLLRLDCLSLFQLIEHGYDLEAHILPLLRKKATARRKGHPIRTWHYFTEAIAEFAATVETELAIASRRVPQRKPTQVDSKEEAERAALQQLLDNVQANLPAISFARGSK